MTKLWASLSKLAMPTPSMESVVEKLIAINKEFGLIKTIEDVEFLFLDYNIDESLSLEQQIDNSLKWAYDNDDFDSFFGEYIDSLYQSDILTLIAECSSSFEISDQSYDLYKFESNLSSTVCLVSKLKSSP